MPLDVGRVTHLGDLMHRAEASNGSAISSNWLLSTDGTKAVTWRPESAGGGSVSYASNSNDVGNPSAAGASSLVSRADHVHRGVRTITSNGSNGLFGDVNLAAGTGIALGVLGQTVTVTNTGSSSGGGGSGAPTTAKYVTTLADATLSAEIVRTFLGNFYNDTYPSSANATYDDEFDDTSGMSGSVNGLAAKWNWRNQGGAGVTWGTAGYVSLNAPAQAANNFRIIEIAGFADGTYDARFVLQGGVNLGASKGEHGGLVIVDSVNGDFHLLGVIKDNANVWYGLQKWTNVTTFGANTALLTSNAAIVVPMMYARVVKSGTTVTFWMSFDGIGWTKVFSETDSVVATRIGLAVNESTNLGEAKLICDYFRKTA